MAETKMNSSDKIRLEEICRRVRARFPGVLAGHDGFICPALRADEDDALIVHVFCMVPVEYEGIYAFMLATAETEVCDNDFHFGFAIWDKDQALSAFGADVARLRATLSPRHIVTRIYLKDVVSTDTILPPATEVSYRNYVVASAGQGLLHAAENQPRGEWSMLSQTKAPENDAHAMAA